MAEQEPVAAQAEEDDEVECTPGYKPPAPKSVEEIVSQDQDDESLVRYKQSLLGKMGATGEKEVIVKKLTILTEDKEFEMDLTAPEDTRKPIVLKEGCEYKVKITFVVKGQIVNGLRYVHGTYRKGMKVDKENYMVGSYGPKEEDQHFISPSDEAPKGMLFRGQYNIKSKFIDDDKNVWLAWEWTLIIKKDFE